MVEGQQHENGRVVVDVVVFDHRRVCMTGNRNCRMRAFVDQVHEFVRCKLKDNKSFVAWLLPSPEWVSKRLHAAWIQAVASFVVDYSNRLYVDMLQLMVVSLFYGPRLVSAHQIDATNSPNRSLARMIRVHEQLMAPLKRRHSHLIERDARNKNTGISGLTLVGQVDAISVLLFLDYDHKKMVCDSEHKVVEIKVESDSKDKKVACKVSVQNNFSNTCEVFSDSLPTFQFELMGFSDDFGQRCLLTSCLSETGVCSVAAPLTIVDEFHVWMRERKFKEDFVVVDKTTPLHEHLCKFERLVWADLRLAFQLSDDSADYLLAVLFWYRPYIVWSEELGDLSEYFSKHNMVDVFGRVSISWSLRETTSPEQSLSCQTIAVMSSWVSSLIKQHFPDSSSMSPRGDAMPRVEPLCAEGDLTSGSVGVQHDVVGDEVDLGNAAARVGKLARKKDRAAQQARRLTEALSSLGKRHERNGDGDPRVSSGAVLTWSHSRCAASSKLSKSSNV